MDVTGAPDVRVVPPGGGIRSPSRDSGRSSSSTAATTTAKWPSWSIRSPWARSPRRTATRVRTSTPSSSKARSASGRTPPRSSSDPVATSPNHGGRCTPCGTRERCPAASSRSLKGGGRRPGRAAIPERAGTGAARPHPGAAEGELHAPVAAADRVERQAGPRRRRVRPVATARGPTSGGRSWRRPSPAANRGCCSTDGASRQVPGDPGRPVRSGRPGSPECHPL